MIIFSLLTTAASLALAAPAAAPVPAPAPVPALAVRDYSYQGTWTYDSYAPCSSDWAHYVIKYNIVYDCTSPDASGTEHCKYHYNDHGTATTYDSGIKYQLVDVSNYQQTFSINPPYDFTESYNVQLRATKQGSGLAFTGKELVTVSCDQNGCQVDIKKGEYQCT